MIRSSFFNSIAGDRKYNASKFAEYFASFIGNGVFPAPINGLQVIEQAAPNMTVIVKAGKVWIDGYIMINDDDYILPIDPADGLLNRIDRVVARLDTVDREIRLEVKKGTFASNPIAPSLQRDADAYELGIADILVSAGVVSIVTAKITDLRNNGDLCGKVDSLIAGDINSLVADLAAHKENIVHQSFAYPADILRASSDATSASISVTAWTKVKEIKVNIEGVIRTSFEMRKDTSLAGAIYGAIYVNGTKIGEERIISSYPEYVVFIEDIEALKGDLVQVYLRSGVAGRGCSCRNFRIAYLVEQISEKPVVNM